MKSILFDHFGDPKEVLQLRDAPIPEPGRNEVRVRMRLSPINPSDLLYIRGRYGRQATFPVSPGFEGMGVVDAVGPGFLKRIRGIKPGRRVVALNGKGGNWQEFVVIPVRQAIPLPDDISDEQAANFFVNPATAVVMTQHVLKLTPGQWLLQSAAASALGKMLIRLGKASGYRTMNVVRRREQVKELQDLGGDAVICSSDENVPERALALTNGAGVPFAIDCVGGNTGLDALRSLSPNGRMLVYGTLTDEPIPVDPRLLIAGQKRIEGFWLSEWVQKQGIFTMLGLFRRVTDLMRKGVLTTDIEATYPLEEIKTAVENAELPGRKGKILLRFAPAG